MATETEQAQILESKPVRPIILSSGHPADKMQELMEKLEQGVKDVFNSSQYKEYLTVMSKFYNYSFNNVLLIAMQKPDASLVAGFSAWKNHFGRHVKKGEKGIKIMAPISRKVKIEEEREEGSQNKNTGKTEDPEQETGIKKITTGFKVVSVFDISQTEGKELPEYYGAEELSGDVEGYADFFAAVRESSPVPVRFEDIPGEAHGYYHQIEKRIALQERMSELQNIKTLIHETAHARLHAIDPAAPEEERADQPNQSTREVQAESVAYVVCQHYGLDTSDYSFAYVAGWSSGKEMPELRASLDVIRNTARDTITAINHQLSLRREHEKESPEMEQRKIKQEEPEAGMSKGKPEEPTKGKEMVRCL